MRGNGTGTATSEQKSLVLSESGRAREEAEISAGLRPTWILLCTSLLADVGLEHLFPGSRGKPFFLEHLKQTRQALGEQISDLSTGFGGRS